MMKENNKSIFFTEQGSLGWIISVFILIIGTIFTLTVVLYQHNYYAYPTRVDLTDVWIADNELYKCYIDSISNDSTQGDYINISGWAVHRGEDLKHYDIRLVLYQESLEDALVFKLAMRTNTEVTTYFDDGLNYDLSGFSANVRNSFTEDNSVYNVALLYNDTENGEGARLIITGKTFIWEDE